MDGYDSGDDFFLTQNSFRDIDEEEINTQAAVKAVDSLLEYGSDTLSPGEPVELLDFSNQKDNLSILPDEEEHEFSGDFPEVRVIICIDFYGSFSVSINLTFSLVNVLYYFSYILNKTLNLIFSLMMIYL